MDNLKEIGRRQVRERGKGGNIEREGEMFEENMPREYTEWNLKECKPKESNWKKAGLSGSMLTLYGCWLMCRKWSTLIWEIVREIQRETEMGRDTEREERDSTGERYKERQRGR